MVAVRLEKDWTDGDGIVHVAGETVDVDAANLAALEADGIVKDWDSGCGRTAEPSSERQV